MRTDGLSAQELLRMSDALMQKENDKDQGETKGKQQSNGTIKEAENK
jgi:hypothetical protein